MTTGNGNGEPPRVARALLRRVVPARERPVVEGELAELFRARAEVAGSRAARWWYRRQVAGFVLRAWKVRRAASRREGTRMGRIEDVTRDVRHALRGLRRRPGFTAVAVLTLALGIGANSAIFALASAYFLDPLPWDRPDDIVLLWETDRNSMEVTTVAPGNYYAWREDTRSFADVAAFNVDGATLSGDGPAEEVRASVVTPGFFDVLGATPLLGRTFDETGTREADGRLVILSHSLWVRRFGSDPGIVGRDIRVDGFPHRVVGVMPEAFRQPERSLSWQRPELWRPMLLDEEHEEFGFRYLRTVARLRPGVSLQQARQEMALVEARMAQAHPESDAGRHILVRTLDEYLMSDARSTLYLLLAAGAAVLLIVCANVANLTLARGEERRREFAVRAALGSGRGRLLRQVLVEGVVLGLAGATVGALLVFLGRDVLQVVQGRYFTGLVDVRLDTKVVLFTAGVALGAGVLFGLPLARTAARPHLRGELNEGGSRAGSGPGSAATRNLLIVGQVGLATTLLAAAALLARSFDELVNVPPGFDADGVVTLTLLAPAARYPARDDVQAYFEDVWRRLEAIPGVRGVGMTSDMPFTTENRWTELRPSEADYDPDDLPRAEFHAVLPEYFGVMGIPVLDGAVFQERWEPVTDVPAVVNRRFAEAFWAGQDPVGRTFVPDWDDDATLRVVGVVGDVLDDGFAARPDPTFYVPWGAEPNRRMAVVLRVAGDPSGFLAPVRQAVFDVDPDIPAADLRTLRSMLVETVARPRGASLIGGTFALLALLVAAAGIYGVLSYSVQSRTREIGIRAALGASGSQLMAMVLGHSTRLLAVGLAVGLIGALVAGTTLSGLLFGVRSWDPASLALAAALLGSVGTLAAWIPARRAVRIHPTEALRQG